MRFKTYPTSLAGFTGLGLSLFAGFSLAANSQTTAQDSSKLDTITVVGTKTETSIQNSPVSVSVLERDEIDKRGADSVAELLRTVPGISVVDSAVAGMKRVRIRGEQSNRVVIFVDGQELTDHSSFGSPFLVDPASVERIEVVRGPASVLHGAKAIGGVINVITRKGAPKPIQLEVGGAFHSGTNGVQGMAAISGTLDDFDYRLSISGDDHSDRRVAKGEHSPDSELLENSGFENKNVSLHLGQKFGADKNHYLALKANYHSLKADGWEDNFALVDGLPAKALINQFAPARAAMVDNNATMKITGFNANLPKRDLNKVGLYYEGNSFSETLRKITANTFYQEIDREFNNLLKLEGKAIEDKVKFSSNTLNVDVNNETISTDKLTTFGAEIQFDVDLAKNHYTVFGLQALQDLVETNKSSQPELAIQVLFPNPNLNQNQQMIPDTDPTFEKAQMQTISAFIQDEWDFADNFKLVVGGRYYHVKSELKDSVNTNHTKGEDSSNSRFVKAAGLTYTGWGHSTLRASYAEGFVVPTLLEQFTDSFAGRGILLNGNPDLKPETSRNYELGLRYKNHGVVFDGALFYSQAKDYIAFESCDGSKCTNGDRYINADKANSYGLEVLMEYWVADTPYTPYLTTTLMRRQLEVAEFSTYKTDLPVAAGQLGLRYENFVGGQELWGDLYMQGQTSVDKKERDIELSGKQSRHLAGWTTLNFAVGTQFGMASQHKITLNLNNLLDKHYRAAVDEMPAMGRNAVLSFSS